MRYFLQRGSWQLAVTCSLLAGSVYAADEHLPPKYTGHVHHKEQAFDLTKKADAAKLLEALQKGEVEDLQLDKPVNVMDLTWDLGLWTLVVFLLLLYILKNVAWKPILEGLHKREENIRLAAEEAKLAREEMNRVRSECQADIAKAHEQVSKMMDQARRDAQQLIDDMRAKGTADIQQERQRLRREIDLARDQALQDIWTQAAQLATLISAKALKRAVTADDHNRLVGDALAELKQQTTKA